MADIQKAISDALKENAFDGDSKKQAMQLLKILSMEIVDSFGIEAELIPNQFIAVDSVGDDYLTFTSPIGNLSGKIVKESKAGYIVNYGSDFFYVSKDIQSNLWNREIEDLGLGGAGGGSEK
jgi:hypothetical protein